MSSTVQPGSEWWRRAVIHQVYIRSFADRNGDGIGDIAGIQDRLPYLRDLGVDGIWINPWYASPMVDAGYDVSDHRDVDPMFGTLADAEGLIAAAHGHGLRVIVDLVPNHTSDRHAWFQEALAEHAVTLDPRMVVQGDFRAESGHEAMRQLLRLGVPVDAVFAENDLMALGAIRALHEAGLGVPVDVSVMGFDDIAVGLGVSPTLTTVAQPIEDIAATALRLLFDRLRDPDAPPERVVLPVALVARDSCAPRAASVGGSGRSV